MNVRTPARSSRSIFCECCGCVGVQGYSHATSSGVAQYELGNGRGRIRCFSIEMDIGMDEHVEEVGSSLSDCMGATEDSTEQDMDMLV